MIDNNQPISLEIPSPTDSNPPISLGGNDTPAPLTPDVAAQRAFKTHMGIGDVLGKDYEDIYADTLSGKEKNLRLAAATTLDIHNANTKAKTLTQLSDLQGGKITDDQLSYVLSPDRVYNRKIDPETVIEQGYGKAVVGSLDAINNPLWDEAKKEIPNLVEDAQDKGASIAAWQEYVQRKMQDVQGEIDNSSMISKAVGIGKTLLPFYSQAIERGQVPGVGYFDGFGGERNKELQARRLNALPFDEAKRQLDEITSNLKGHDPYVALDFLSSVLRGQTTSEIRMGNVGTILDATAVAGTASNVIKGIKLLNTARTAVKDVVDASKAPEVTKAAISNAAGDAASASVHEATANLAKDLQGGPVNPDRVIDQLTSNLRDRMKYMYQHAGRFGQEGVNRIEERQNQVLDEFFKTYQSALKVDRIPELKASPELINKAREDIKKDYRGMPNKVIDVKGDDNGMPYYEPYSNTWWFEHQIGTESGEFFETEKKARNSARKNGLILRTPSEDVRKLDNEIEQITQDLKFPPDMNADVNELNRYDAMEKRLLEAKQERLKISFDRSDKSGYEVKQQGLGWYLSKMTPYNEQNPLMRDALSKTDYDKIWQKGWLKTFLGWGRTPEEVLSTSMNDQRHIATFGPSVLLREFNKASEEIAAIPHRYRDEWSRALEASRHMVDEQGKPGYWFSSPNQLEDFYQRNFNRLPTDVETEGYFAFVRNYELERSLMNMASVRNQARLGVEMRRLYVGKGKRKVYSDFFPGIDQREFPGGDDTVAIFRNGKLENITRANAILPVKYGTELRKGVEKGELKVLRNYDPEQRHLKGFAGIDTEKVRYIITDGNYESKPIEFDQIPVRGGVHFEYKADHYFKQAKIVPEVIGRSLIYHYEGDNTLHAAFPVGKMNDEFLKHYNEVRELIRKGKIDEAEVYHDQYFDEPWADHFKKYQDGWINPEEPIYVVPRNKTIGTIDKKGLENRYSYADPVTNERKTRLRDGTTTGSDARQYQIQYTKERDAENLTQIKNTGTTANPLFQFEPAEMVDAIPVYERSLKRLINSMWMDDMKMNSVEHWLEEAKDQLKADEQDLRHRPFFHFNFPEWKSGTDADIIRQQNLKSAKQKIDYFAGVPGKLENFFRGATQDIVNGIYGKAGEKAAILSNAALTKVRNPVTFMRTVTTHAKLGLFNIPSFLKQFSTMANVYAIAGARPAASGTMAMMLHNWYRINGTDEILDHLDSLASKFNVGGYKFRPGDFREAVKLIEDSGFHHVGGEHAFTDNPYYTNIIEKQGTSFLDWGMSFFREGAAAVRSASLFTAYLEHRANNLGALSRLDKETILSRASLLDHNMNRSSNSILQTGVAAPAGQFMSYSLRLMELTTGHRLTLSEKARLIATSSVLYGLPAGASLVYLPMLGDYLRQVAHEQGWDIHDNYFKSVIVDGAGAALLHFITGKWYNVSQFGPESYQVLEDAMNSDSTIWKMVGGAAGSVTYNLVADMKPIWNWGMSFFRPDNQQYRLTASDMLQPFKEASTVSRWAQAIQAYETGRYFSKNGTYLTDVDKAQIPLMLGSGLVPTDVANITVSTHAFKAREELNKSTEKDFQRLIGLEFKAAADNDLQQAEVYHRNAMSILEVNGYPYEKRAGLLAKSIQQNIPLVRRLKDDYFLKNVPPEQREKLRSIYMRSNQVEQEEKK